MSKPDWCPQEVWDEAFKAMPPVNQEAYDKSPFAMVLHLGFARAILAAEKRGEEREREACALAANEAITNGTDLSTLEAAIIGSLAASAIRARSTP